MAGRVKERLFFGVVDEARRLEEMERQTNGAAGVVVVEEIPAQS